MNLALITQEGKTERHSYFRNCLFGSQRHTCKIYPTSRNMDVLRDDIESIFRPARKRKAPIPNCIVIIWDTDCHPDLKALGQLICKNVPNSYRDKVFVYFAHPEPEIWLLADWDNTFGKKYGGKNVTRLENYLKKHKLNFNNLEGFIDYDEERNTCRKKISALIKKGVNEIGGRYSKALDTPALMMNITWQTVAEKLPAFKPLYDDWLGGDDSQKHLRRCDKIK